MWSNFEAIKFAVLVIPLGTAAIKEGRLIMPPFVLMNISASENKKNNLEFICPESHSVH